MLIKKLLNTYTAGVLAHDGIGNTNEKYID
jgi:hypothetical protein